MIKLVKLWVLVSAACAAAGWILSALHQLSRASYAVVFLVFAAALAVYCWQGRVAVVKKRAKPLGWRLRRFRRPLPLVFLLTAIAAALGGTFHAPNNYDALTYRFPRVLHWWAAGGWHWISSPNMRMNVSGTLFEWMMMPIFVLTHSDRFFYILNIIPYFLLPSLVFVTFVAAGLARRVAWFWMWLMPAALCYALQAGSISNDTIAATYFLATIYFALRARQTGRIADLWMAFLAAGLTTGVKASNLPLLLPIVWVFWPCLGLIRRHLAGSLVIVLLSALVSFVPTAVLNQRYAGNWGGDPNNIEKVQVQKPLAGILGNGLQLVLQSLEPPFLPLARTVENWIWDRFPEKLQTILKNDFPRFVVGFRELPQEESAGVGIGITVIVIVSIVASYRFRRRQNPVGLTVRPRPPGLALGVLTWIALLVFMTKLGSESTSRLISAYYPLLLLPLLLEPAQGVLVRQRWFGRLAVCVGAIALMAVILTPSRPLWPAERFFDWAAARFPRSVLLARARTVYAVYRCRNDLFAPLRRSIPDSVQVIGLIQGGDDTEASLWHPFGARRVVSMDPVDRSRDTELQWFVVKNTTVAEGSPEDFDRWVQHEGGNLIIRQSLIEKAGYGPETRSVVFFPRASN